MPHALKAVAWVVAEDIIIELHVCYTVEAHTTGSKASPIRLNVFKVLEIQKEVLWREAPTHGPGTRKPSNNTSTIKLQ